MAGASRWPRTRGRRIAARLRTAAHRLVHQGRPPGLRTAKTVLAAVAAFAVAEALHTSSSPVLAPLTALLVVQLTMYETLAHGRERIVGVVAGVLVAVLFASATGLTWWSLGLVVGVSLVAGRLLRLGPHLLEVPISAMLILAVGGSEQAAQGRVVETLVGAAIGVAVNLVIAPPLYIQPASDAIHELATHMATYTDELAAALREPWSRAVAEQQLAAARRLSSDVARADRHLARTEESARLNPRGRQARRLEPRLRHTLDALEHTWVGLRNLARALLDRTFFVPETEAGAAYSAEQRAALADVVDALGRALREAAAVPGGLSTSPRRPDVAPATADTAALLDRCRTRLADELVVDPATDPAAWAQHGALLDAVDRLRVELRTALNPPAAPQFPSPLADRRQRALRAAVRAARRRRPTRPAAWRRR